MKDVNEFCHKYQATVGQSPRTWRRSQQVPYDVWLKDPDVFKTIECEDVPTVEITMPEDRFRALLEHDRWIERAGLENNRHFTVNVARVSAMVVEHEQGCRIRHQHPAVQKAWEQYQIMLGLCASEK